MWNFALIASCQQSSPLFFKDEERRTELLNADRIQETIYN